jgi:hypothetical protein
MISGVGCLAAEEAERNRVGTTVWNGTTVRDAGQHSGIRQLEPGDDVRDKEGGRRAPGYATQVVRITLYMPLFAPGLSD